MSSGWNEVMPSEEYWEKPQGTAERRSTLAGYRIADLIIAAADNTRTYRAFVPR